MENSIDPKIEAGIISLASIPSAIQLYEAGAISWIWLFTGSILAAVICGPIATTQYGQQMGSWFHSIGGGGRIIAILIAAVLIWRFILTFQPPEIPLNSFTLGGIIGLLLPLIKNGITSNRTSTA